MKAELKTKCFRSNGTEYQGNVFFTFGTVNNDKPGQMYAAGNTLIETEWLYDEKGNSIIKPEYAGWTASVDRDKLTSLVDSFGIEEGKVLNPIFLECKEDAKNSYYILPDGRMIDDSYGVYVGHPCLYGDSKYDEEMNAVYTISHPRYKELDLPTFNELSLHEGWILMEKGTDGVWRNKYESIAK